MRNAFFVPGGLDDRSQAVYCLVCVPKRIRPVGNGLMRGTELCSRAQHSTTPWSINHTVPYGTGSAIPHFQAFHAWLPSTGPYGTSADAYAIWSTARYHDSKTPLLHHSACQDSRTRTTTTTSTKPLMNEIRHL